MKDNNYNYNKPDNQNRYDNSNKYDNQNKYDNKNRYDNSTKYEKQGNQGQTRNWEQGTQGGRGGYENQGGRGGYENQGGQGHQGGYNRWDTQGQGNQAKQWDTQKQYDNFGGQGSQGGYGNGNGQTRPYTQQSQPKPSDSHSSHGSQQGSQSQSQGQGQGTQPPTRTYDNHGQGGTQSQSHSHSQQHQHQHQHQHQQSHTQTHYNQGHSYQNNSNYSNAHANTKHSSSNQNQKWGKNPSNNNSKEDNQKWETESNTHTNNDQQLVEHETGTEQSYETSKELKNYDTKRHILTNLRKVEYNENSKYAFSYTIYFDPYIPDDNHILKNLFFEAISVKHDVTAKIGQNFIYGNKVFGKLKHEDDQVYVTTNFKTGEEYTVTIRFEREIKDDINLINHLHKKQLYNDGYSKKKNQNKKYDQFVESNNGSDYIQIENTNIKYLNGFSTHLSKRGNDFYALTNPCGRFVHNKSVHEIVQTLDPKSIFNLRFKNMNNENPLELIFVSYDNEINKTYKILHIINDVDMHEADPLKRFDTAKYIDSRVGEEETDNYVEVAEDETNKDYKFKSFMYGNDFEHMVIRQDKVKDEFSYIYNYVNNYYDVVADMKSSFYDYFKNNYNYEVKNARQSVIICKSKDNEFYVKPVEVCYINHLPQNINANREFKKLQNHFTRSKFDHEIALIDSLVTKINGSDENLELIPDLRVNQRVVCIEEYFTISPPNLQTHQQQLTLENNSKFFNTQVREFYSKRRINNACVLYSNKMKPYIQAFKNKFIQCYKQKGCNFGYIETMFLDHNYNKNWELLIDQLTKDYEVIVLLIPKFLSSLYQKFKIFHIFNERTVVQVIRESTIVYLYCDQEGCKNYAKYGYKYPQYCKYHQQQHMRFFEESDESKLHSIVNNVIYEISRKLYNFSPWVVEFKSKEDYILPADYRDHVMYMGVDVCHSINNHKKPSVFVMSNSMDPELKDWSCEHLILDKYHREFITKESYVAMFSRCLVKYQKVNKSYPRLVFIYRDGIGDAEEKYAEYEIDWIKEMSPAFGNFKVVYIAVNKNNLLRLSKPMLPGSIVNELGITQKDNHFYIFTTLGRKSKNIIPKYCKILVNELEGQLDFAGIYRITFYLCYCYYSYAGVISIPVPIKLADKRAYMVYNFKMDECKEFYDKYYKKYLDYWGFTDISLE